MSCLLLLHGFTGAPASWDEVIAHLRPGTRVLRPALAGHGPRAAPVTRSPIGLESREGVERDGRQAPTPCQSIVEEGPAARGGDSAREFRRLQDDWRSRWDAELDRLADLVEDESDVHLVGYSMGGRLGWGLLARQLPCITRATLIGAHPGLTDERERAARAETDARWVGLLADEGLRAFVDAWERLPLWASQARLDDARLAARRALRMSHDPAGLAAAIDRLGLASMPPTPLNRIRVPVRLVVGALDTKHLAIAEDTVSRLARSELRVVSDTGHDVTLESPAALAALLEEEAP